MSVATPDPPRAEVLPSHTPQLFAAAVERAVACLRRGGIVALPTETVYGLAAHAFDAAAVARIFEAKGRPSHNPVIVHVVGRAMARECVREWPAEAERLAAAFWPGPLTLVLPRGPSVPAVVTAGGDTVGLRWPAHPLMQAVIRACGFPLAAPSANRSNEVSPTCAAHVLASLGDRIPLIVDGGPSQVGIESTVLDLTRRPPRVLRPGMVHAESLGAVLDAGNEGAAQGAPPRSPGRMPRHYSPQGRVLVRRWRDDADLSGQLAALGAEPADVHVLAHDRIPAPATAGRVCVIPNDAEAYARALYAEWHRCDDLGARWIVMEDVPPTMPWQGIADRLRRAAARDPGPAPGG